MDRKYDTDDDDEKAQWRRFEKFVRDLNGKSKEGESVKVLFLGRHGQGWHNVAETKYGTKNWDVRGLRSLLFITRLMRAVLLLNARRSRRYSLV